MAARHSYIDFLISPSQNPISSDIGSRPPPILLCPHAQRDSTTKHENRSTVNRAFAKFVGSEECSPGRAFLSIGANSLISLENLVGWDLIGPVSILMSQTHVSQAFT